MNNKFLGIVLLLLLSVLLISCASKEVTTTNTHPPNSLDTELAVYKSPEEIKRPYEVVCIVRAQTDSTHFNSKAGEAAIKEAKIKTLESGGDAILIRDLSRTSPEVAGLGPGSVEITGIKYIKNDSN